MSPEAVEAELPSFRGVLGFVAVVPGGIFLYGFILIGIVGLLGRIPGILFRVLGCLVLGDLLGISVAGVLFGSLLSEGFVRVVFERIVPLFSERVVR